MALNLSSTEMPLISVHDLERSTQDTSEISPMWHLTVCHKVFSDSDSMWWIIWLLRHTSVFPHWEAPELSRIIELFVNKIAHWRIIYLPFQGPDMERVWLVLLMKVLAGRFCLITCLGFCPITPKHPCLSCDVPWSLLAMQQKVLRGRVRLRLKAGCLGDRAAQGSRSPPCFPIQQTYQSLLQIIEHMDPLV